MIRPAVLKTKELEFTTLNFYENYVISRPRENALLEETTVAGLVKECTQFYRGKKFFYLSFRVNNYNVNPIIYLNLKNVKNLAGIGIISQNPTAVNMARFERRFSSVPFEIFEDLDAALNWVQHMLEQEK